MPSCDHLTTCKPSPPEPEALPQHLVWALNPTTTSGLNKNLTHCCTSSFIFSGNWPSFLHESLNLGHTICTMLKSQPCGTLTPSQPSPFSDPRPASIYEVEDQQKCGWPQKCQRRKYWIFDVGWFWCVSTWETIKNSCQVGNAKVFFSCYQKNKATSHIAKTISKSQLVFFLSVHVIHPSNIQAYQLHLSLPTPGTSKPHRSGRSCYSGWPQKPRLQRPFHQVHVGQ